MGQENSCCSCEYAFNVTILPILTIFLPYFYMEEKRQGFCHFLGDEKNIISSTEPVQRDKVPGIHFNLRERHNEADEEIRYQNEGFMPPSPSLLSHYQLVPFFFFFFLSSSYQQEDALEGREGLDIPPRADLSHMKEIIALTDIVSS